jgi:two-component system LytT family response regulator
MIVEDEPNAMKLLEDYIGKIPFLQLSGKCYDAMAAVSFLKTNTVDVIFLDINMPSLTGIEMAAMISKEQKIIFTTAYSEFALDSFEYHVVDYILKPITFKRFMHAINKLQSFHAGGNSCSRNFGNECNA